MCPQVDTEQDDEQQIISPSGLVLLFLIYTYYVTLSHLTSKGNAIV